MESSVRTGRLLLRRWRADDLPAFAELNADPAVMEYLVEPMTRRESDALAARFDTHIEEHGWGLWAVEVADTATRGEGRFAGFTGLAVPSWHAHFTPAVEVGWRLARWAWGYGYATEAARASLAVGFDRLGLAEIVSFTAPSNVRSRAVMERIGMARDTGGDFDHPSVPAGHPLRRHVLYRLAAEEWGEQQLRRG